MTTCKRLSTVASSCLLFVATAARAQSTEDQAAARTLFEDARKLAKGGQYAEACPKFEAAAKLYAGAGILLNLGDCYEKTGRFASAWTEFGASESAAERANRRDQAAEAGRRQAAVQPKVAKLNVVVAHPVAGLAVARDGTDLAQGVWGSATPVDAGVHTVRAGAPGYEAWTTSVTVVSPGQTISVEVPPLVALPIAASPSPPTVAIVDGASSSGPAPDTAPHKRARIPGFVLLGAGAAVAAGGAVLMGVEAGRTASARQSNSAATNRVSINEYDSAKTPYYVGLGLTIAGAAVAAAGVIWVATAHREIPPQTGLSVTPWVASAAAGCEVGGAW